MRQYQLVKGDPHELIPGCGHYCLEEAPEEMLAALTAFLAPYRDRAAAAQHGDRAAAAQHGDRAAAARH